MPNSSFAPRRHGWPVLPALQLPFHCPVIALSCPVIALSCHCRVLILFVKGAAVGGGCNPEVPISDSLHGLPLRILVFFTTEMRRRTVALALNYRPPHTPMTSQQLRGKAKQSDIDWLLVL